MIKPYYEHKGITIYHGDCLDILPQLDKVDLVLTDPPYGINTDSEMHKKSGQQYGRAAAPKRYYDKSNWDTNTPDKAIKLILSMGKEIIIWGGNYFDLPPARCYLVWDKVNGDNNFADCELAWTNLDKPIRIKRHMWNGMLRRGNEFRYNHPTQKPIAIKGWCIELATNPKLILDPFMGSGTTLVACKDLNRKAIGIEIEEKYCEIAVKRLSQEVFQFNHG